MKVGVIPFGKSEHSNDISNLNYQFENNIDFPITHIGMRIKGANKTERSNKIKALKEKYLSCELVLSYGAQLDSQVKRVKFLYGIPFNLLNGLYGAEGYGFILPVGLFYLKKGYSVSIRFQGDDFSDASDYGSSSVEFELISDLGSVDNPTCNYIIRQARDVK